MKKFIVTIILLCIVLALTGCATSDVSTDGTVTLDQAIQAAAENIEANLDEGTVIAVLNFSSPSERFSAYVLEELSERLVNGKKLVVVDRSELDLIRKEEKYQLSGEVSDESAQAIGKKLGAQVIVSGSLRSIEKIYRFRIRTLVVQTAVIATASSADINPREPKVVSLLAGARPLKALPESPIPDNMVLIQGGTFTMAGSYENEQGLIVDEAQHQITISSFYMGKYEVTQKEYQVVMGTNPSKFRGDNFPVETVSWYDAIIFCNKLSIKEGLNPAYQINGKTDPAKWNIPRLNTENERAYQEWYSAMSKWDEVIEIVPGSNGYRLPTEAQWVYACRADETYMGWNSENSDGTTHPVGQKPANKWGLHDMYGNVYEWCWTWMGRVGYDDYSSDASIDPLIASSKSPRILGGGSWQQEPGGIRKSYGRPHDRSARFGFRIVRPFSATPVATPTRPIAPEMVRINGGTFTMGNPAYDQWNPFTKSSPASEHRRSNDNERPQHQVTVSSFWMGKYEVTQREYIAIMQANPSVDKRNDLPVFRVSWYDAIEYCNALSRREGLTPAYTIDKSHNDPNNQSSQEDKFWDDVSWQRNGDTVRWLVTWNRKANGYRLPTEAEWEYACRAGTTTAYNTGAEKLTDSTIASTSDRDLAKISDNTGWYSQNSGNRIHPVGQKPANAWGLYDMHGNVWEWCWDWYGDYSGEAQTDPQGVSSGRERIIRGGNWDSSAWDLGSARRAPLVPSRRDFDSVGFRVVRSYSEKK